MPDAGRVALSLQQLSGAAANLQTLLNLSLQQLSGAAANLQTLLNKTL